MYYMCVSKDSPYHQTLSACESELQRLASEAMAGGEYDSARYGLELAEQVASLYKDSGALVARPASSQGQKSRPASRQKTQSKTSAPPEKKMSTAKKSHAKSTPTKTYPRFARDEDKLVKIGWSKRTREEYEHKAPRIAVDTFVLHLRKHTTEGRIFKLDDIMPVADPESDGELPSYQIYMVLGWLRSLDAVSKHGRNGYSAKANTISKKALSQAWDQLPSNTNQDKG